MHQQIRIFAYEFAIILTIMIVMASVVFLVNDDAVQTIDIAIDEHLRKTNLSQKLFVSAAERTRFTQSLLLGKEVSSPDRGELEKLNLNYTRLGEQLLPLLTAKEGEILLEINQIDQRLRELLDQILVLFEHGSHSEALQILQFEAKPETDLMMAKLKLLLDLQHGNARQLASANRETSNAVQLRFGFYALATILACLLTALLAVYFGLKMSRELDEMNNCLEEKVSERTESLLDTQMELIADNNELARLASTDPLTGLFNRNYMNDILKRELSKFRRYGQPFGIVMIDIDHFKRVNDTHGHDVGDTILTQMAQQLKAAVRNSDFVGRWGGEEFIICCSATDIEDLEAIAENVRLAIEQTEFDTIRSLTISLGCAIIQPEEDITSLIKRSDIALYDAKNSGRNQTRISAAGA